MPPFTIEDREFESQEEFVLTGRRCGTPTFNEFQKARVRSHIASLRSVAGDVTADIGPIVIPVLFHVIHDGPTGNVPDQQLDRQIEVLNQGYSPHGVTFTRAGVTRTNNATWFQMTMGSPAERAAKTALHKDPERQLNFYTAGLGASLLGWATFPSDLAAEPERDGVVCLYSSLPGGTFTPYDLGMTAVHEVGHWLGLYHTFEGGCTPPGDEVDDTPFEASANFGPAKPGRNTCPQPGNDPTTNYMDYTDDNGMTDFSPGQITRIQEQVALYRPGLLSALPSGLAAADLGIDFETGVF